MINNGGNSDGDPPLPIPNREVKPVSADGTAIPSGRVGSRQPSETFRSNSGGLFFVSGGEICCCVATDCHANAAICDKCRSGKGYCHVNEVFCDNIYSKSNST